jgi:hypothetical protein
MVNNFQKVKNKNLKEECLRYLGGKVCFICKTEILPISCYDFHHIKGIKEKTISEMISEKKRLDKKLKNELDKCKIVCSNCHRIITHEKLQLLIDNNITDVDQLRTLRLSID